MSLRAIAAFAVLLLATPAFAKPPWAGTWNISARFAGGEASSAMTLTVEGDKVTGTSGPLDENRFFPLTIAGKPSVNGADLELKASGDVVGSLKIIAKGDALTGAGVLYGVPVTVTGARPTTTAAATPRTHAFKPTTYALQYSARGEPALRIRPGDTVQTSTLDNKGRDAGLVWRAMPGNSLTGPFFVEGAMPGDTLVVHLERVALNRDTAEMYGGALNERAIPGGYVQEPTKGWGRVWTLDREKGVARLAAPGAKLNRLELPLKPMVGSIGVAPPLNQAIYAGDLGFHGGNLDYNRLVEGATLYLPVWAAGGWLYLGDGHALQGDGEISGQGLETSLDVTFRVELIRGETLGQVWMEDAEDVMVSGIDNGLDASLAMATAGMARWLKQRYGLNDSEVATLMSAAIRYDIAEVVDGRPHVVARISKAVLGTLK